MREGAANDEYEAFLDELYAEVLIDDIIEENYHDPFSRFDEPPDHHLDSAFEERYYLSEPDFDYL
jgi:subtilase family serine protease